MNHGNPGKKKEESTEEKKTEEETEKEREDLEEMVIEMKEAPFSHPVG